MGGNIVASGSIQDIMSARFHHWQISDRRTVHRLSESAAQRNGKKLVVAVRGTTI